MNNSCQCFFERLFVVINVTPRLAKGNIYVVKHQDFRLFADNFQWAILLKITVTENN